MVRLHWIDCPNDVRLAVSARPQGGDALDQDVAEWSKQGVRLVASMLSEPEVAQLGLEQAPQVCAAHEIELVRIPITDLGTRDIDPTLSERIAYLAQRAGQGVPTLLHCRMGIGRATMIAVAVLAHLGLDPQESWPRVRQARGCAVPDTQAQHWWTVEYASQLREPPELDGLFE